MKLKGIITLTVIIFFTMLGFANDDDVVLDLKLVPEDEVSGVFSNSQATIIDEIKNDVFVNKYYEDGTVTSIRQKQKWFGVWYIDDLGQHCIKWNNKDVSDCGIIMQDEEGNWVKVKRGKIVKSYESIDKISPK